MRFEFHTKLSTWIAVTIFVVSAFTTLPTGINHFFLAFEGMALAVLIFVAHREQRK